MKQPSAPYVLWLPSWYPNKMDPFDGDFIQRHAKAVSLHKKIHVIFIKADEEGRVTNGSQEEFIPKENLTEQIIYFKKSVSFFGRINSFFKWIKLLKKTVGAYIDENGEPELVHVHIALRAGIIARWIKRKWGIPYVVTEQWGGYLPEAKEKLSDLPIYLQILWRRIMREATSISVVSLYLGQCIKKRLPGISFNVIPNVVDTNIFKLIYSERNNITSFIHVSLLNYQKNVDDIVRAMNILKKEGLQFRLHIFGPRNDDLSKLVNDLNLQDEIAFHGEVPQDELARFVQRSDALILYSRYETFGCVIIEALACGKPVILSDLPVMHENTLEGVNAVFAENENPVALSEKLKWFMQNRTKFDSVEIASRAALRYNYSQVGKEFANWYEQTLQTQR